MDIDQNDLLSTNIFINKPELNIIQNNKETQEFREFYEKDQQINNEQ